MRIGIDLGGTKIEGILLADSGDILQRHRVYTPQGDYSQTLQQIRSLIDQLTDDKNLAIGIGTPGAPSPDTGLMRNANSTCLNGQPLQHDLEKLLQRPVRVANDADCFALSEASDGAGKDANSVFGVIVGTGTGGGLVIRKQLLKGPNAIAGEWGHNPLPWPQENELPGPQCYCGKQGCVETWLSGPGLVRDHGGKLQAEEITQQAMQGEKEALATLDRYYDRMARCLAQVINIVDPEVIVLGGGLSNVETLYNEVPRRLPRYVFSDTLKTQLKPPVHGDSSGVRGAAWLWPIATDS
jgi:predicted NBD/HSP70 family sugar kinase